MNAKGESIVEQLLQRQALRRWTRTADEVAMLDHAGLRSVRSRARALKRQLDRVIHETDDRLTLPMIGSSAMRRPEGADWSWRPEPWRARLPVPGMAEIGNRTEAAPGVTLFHDCRLSELSLRQIRNQREADLAPFGMRLDVFRFDGSFLSLAIGLPPAAVAGLRRKHIIRLDTIVEVEKPLEIFARLNVKHGPNVEQIVRELPLGAQEVMVEFDLAHTQMNEKRVEGMWVDLIFEGPRMNQITLRDVTLCRRPRAEL
ncbi:MAG: hypothetical protein KGK00_00555 [Paracoccaceae bacterium]|nr:hypothetical protein [Paracoccaceae bacterium]